MTEVAEQPQTQLQRTELAWRRTLVGVVAVAGIGSIHLVGGRHLLLGVVVGALWLLALIPITLRIRRLRAGDARPLSWEPLAMTIGLVALAVAISVLG